MDSLGQRQEKLQCLCNASHCCTDKAAEDFDDAMQLLNKLYKEGGDTSYENATEKTALQIAFNAFYPEYARVKEERDEVHWTKD